MSYPSPHNETSASPSTWTRHSELYFSDGNVILLCESTVFKVWRGILAVNSEVFQDLFSLEPHQPDTSEKYDGVPVVRLHDSAKDMEILLKTLCIAKYAVLFIVLILNII